MKLTIVEKNLLSWTAMHIDFVMCKKSRLPEVFSTIDLSNETLEQKHACCHTTILAKNLKVSFQVERKGSQRFLCSKH